MQYFYKRSQKYLFFIVLITFIFIALIFYTLSFLEKKENLLTKLEKSINITRTIFEEEKDYALSLSLLLSKDKEIIKSFYENNREKSFKIINDKIKMLEQFQHLHIDIQLHKQDLTTYLRSWDINKKDEQLSSFRKGLVKVKNSLKPFVSVELGKRVNIKAISPIIKNNSFKGSIEVIIGFERIQKKMQDKGYKLIVLLNKNYLKIATKLRDNKTIDNYVIVNKEDINLLKKLDFGSLKDYGYITNNKFAFSYFAYFNDEKEKLGYIFTVLDNANKIEMQHAYQQIDFTSKAK